MTGISDEASRAVLDALMRMPGPSPEQALYGLPRKAKGLKTRLIGSCMTPDQAREWRKKCGLTKKALAAEFDLSPRTILAWERGERPVRRAYLYAFRGLLAATRRRGSSSR